MKSLKRTLSLVLALVMVLGLFGGLSINAAATDFTDDGKIQYKEAVDVMTAIGAINGYKENGEFVFKPGETITRAEAAKLVTYTVLGEAAAKRLSGVSTKFSDVPADKYDWAIPSIVYLTNQGVINGVGGDKFNPEGEVTGYEVGKMLLRSIGYGAKKEYVGDGWDLNVAIDGAQNKSGVFNDRAKGANPLSQAASREEVALYCFNAIQATKVRYVSALDIYVDDGTQLGAAGSLTIMNTIYTDPELKKYDRNSTGADKAKAIDAFGNPSTVWMLGNDKIGSYIDEATLTYTSTQTKDALEKALKGLKVRHSAAVSSVTNGEVPNSDDFAIDANASTMATTLVDTSHTGTGTGDPKPYLGNGYLTRIYAENGEVTNITVVKNVLATVGDTNKTTGAVTLKVVTPVNDRVGAIDANRAASFTVNPDDPAYSVVSGLAKGNRVMVTPLGSGKACSAWTVAEAYVPQQITGKITTAIRDKADTMNVAFIVDGKTYGVHTGASSVAKQNVLETVLDEEDDANIWLDRYGYIVDYEPVDEEVEVNSKILVILDKYQRPDATDDNKVANYVMALFTNGTTSEIKVDSTSYGLNEFKICSFTKSNGIYSLTDMTAGALSATDASKTASGTGVPAAWDNLITLGSASGTKKFKTGDVALTLDVNGTKGAAAADNQYYNNYYSSNVKFVNINSKTGAATVMDGVQALEIVGTSYAIVERQSATDLTPVVTMVVLTDAKPAGELDPNTVVFVGQHDKKIKIEANAALGTNVNVYEVYINGELKEFRTTDSLTANKFYTITTTKVDGVYTVNEITNLADVNIYAETALKDGAGNSLKLPTAGKDVNVKDAVVIDSRTEAYINASSGGSKEAPMLTDVTTGPEFVEAIKTQYTDIGAQVVCDKNGNAKIIYITSVLTANELNSVTLKTESVTINGLTYSIKLDTGYAIDTTGKVNVIVTRPTGTTYDAQNTMKDTITFTVSGDSAANIKAVAKAYGMEVTDESGATDPFTFTVTFEPGTGSLPATATAEITLGTNNLVIRAEGNQTTK